MVRLLKIITFALAQGAIVFGAVALFLNSGETSGKPDILTWIGLGMAVLMLVNHFVIPPIIARAWLSRLTSADLQDKSDEERFSMIAPAFQTQHIIACAMLEGAAFFNLVAYIIDGCLYSLIAAGVPIGMILMKMPTMTRVEFWVQDRGREIDLR
jgi:hypothetical protein